LSQKPKNEKDCMLEEAGVGGEPPGLSMQKRAGESFWNVLEAAWRLVAQVWFFKKWEKDKAASLGGRGRRISSSRPAWAT
jgi:hypothetical protein